MKIRISCRKNNTSINQYLNVRKIERDDIMKVGDGKWGSSDVPPLALQKRIEIFWKWDKHTFQSYRRTYLKISTKL